MKKIKQLNGFPPGPGLGRANFPSEGSFRTWLTTVTLAHMPPKPLGCSPLMRWLGFYTSHGPGSMPMPPSLELPG